MNAARAYYGVEVVFQPCFLIPIYNHSETLNETLDALSEHGLACLVVDDGSDALHRDAIEAACRRYSWVTLIRHPQNAGKGAAVKTGIRAAADRTFSHAFQIDADAQHDLTAIPSFIARAQAQPDNAILGNPVFDHSVPTMRRLSRYLTHVWVWINTLSLEIADAMCGFRIYPIASTVKVMDGARTCDRMEFDMEVVVRLSWAGTKTTMLPVATRYPEGGRSHFRLVRDNVLISAMHARSFVGMLRRLPQLLARHRGNANHEAHEAGER